MADLQQECGEIAVRPGVLVISLDFELLWGVRDHCPPDSQYRSNIMGARQAVPRMLDLFEEFGVAATWATVGFLFAETREELLAFSPDMRPVYLNDALDPYGDEIGYSEDDDPMHFAPSLLKQIRRSPLQEVACHTFSHYYCLEPGASVVSFKADMRSAVALALKRGIHLRSLVFPRNQVMPEALSILPELGFTAYRGGERGWMHDTRPFLRNQAHRRGARLLDQYVVPPSSLVDWRELNAGPVANVRGSLFLRPFAASRPQVNLFRVNRIAQRMKEAARHRKIFHLWWHPHNFGRDLEVNLDALRKLLQAFAQYREQFDFRSMSMAGAASQARRSVFHSATSRFQPAPLSCPV